MQPQTTFTASHRAAIAALCCDLTRRLQHPVTVEYGATDDDRFHDAALCVEELPVGSWGSPGPLVSILAGPGIGAGLAVMAADGSSLADGVDLGHAVQAARAAALQQFRSVTDGALQFSGAA